MVDEMFVSTQYVLIEQDNLPPHRHVIGTYTSLGELLDSIRDYLIGCAEFPLIVETTEQSSRDSITDQMLVSAQAKLAAAGSECTALVMFHTDRRNDQGACHLICNEKTAWPAMKAGVSQILTVWGDYVPKRLSDGD